MPDLQKSLIQPGNRRGFLKTLGAGALGIAGASLLPHEAEAAPAVTDADVLNFALNLEYLEGEYYSYALTGQGLAANGYGITGSGTPGPTTIKANPKVNFTTPALQQFAEVITYDEQHHVGYLRDTLSLLGAQPIAKPAINLQNVFDVLAQAAGIGQSFDPFANEINFFLGAFIFEDVGVTAYKGASTLLRNKNVLENAAGILAVEAFHAANIRTVLFNADQANPGLGIAGIAQKISNLRDMADNSVTPPTILLDDDQGIIGDTDNSSLPPPRNTIANTAPTDANAIAFSRTPRMVLNVVYNDPTGTAHSGGFFPNGTNGAVS